MKTLSSSKQILISYGVKDRVFGEVFMALGQKINLFHFGILTLRTCVIIVNDMLCYKLQITKIFFWQLKANFIRSIIFSAPKPEGLLPLQIGFKIGPILREGASPREGPQNGSK